MECRSAEDLGFTICAGPGIDGEWCHGIGLGEHGDPAAADTIPRCDAVVRRCAGLPRRRCGGVGRGEQKADGAERPAQGRLETTPRTPRGKGEGAGGDYGNECNALLNGSMVQECKRWWFASLSGGDWSLVKYLSQPQVPRPMLRFEVN